MSCARGGLSSQTLAAARRGRLSSARGLLLPPTSSSLAPSSSCNSDGDNGDWLQVTTAAAGVA